MKQGENNIPRIENQKHWQVVDAVFHHIEFSFITDPINFAKIWNLKLGSKRILPDFSLGYFWLALWSQHLLSASSKLLLIDIMYFYFSSLSGMLMDAKRFASD